MVDLAPLRALDRPVPLKQIKADAALSRHTPGDAVAPFRDAHREARLRPHPRARRHQAALRPRRAPLVTEDRHRQHRRGCSAPGGHSHHAVDPAPASGPGAPRAGAQGLRGGHVRSEWRQPSAVVVRRRHRSGASRLGGGALPARLSRKYIGPALEAAEDPGVSRSDDGATCARHSTWRSISRRCPCCCSSPAGPARGRPQHQALFPGRAEHPAGLPRRRARRIAHDAARSPSVVSSTSGSGFPAERPSCAMLPIGWPRGRYGRPPRKSVDDCLHWERFSSGD